MRFLTSYENSQTKSHETDSAFSARRLAGHACAVFGEEVNLAGVVAFIDGFDSAGPSGAVAVVDLAEIEQGFLNGAAPGDAAAFHTRHSSSGVPCHP